MKGILGLIFILAGIILGVYVGVWLMFIGGISSLVNGLIAMSASPIIWGIVRIVFSWVGWLIFYTGFVVGTVLIGLETQDRE